MQLRSPSFLTLWMNSVPLTSHFSDNKSSMDAQEVTRIESEGDKTKYHASKIFNTTELSKLYSVIRKLIL